MNDKDVTASSEVKTDLHHRISVLIIAVIAFLIYANSLGNGLIWDDTVVILKNQSLRDDPLSLFSGIDSGRDTDITPYYRPLALLSFFVEGRLHGFNASYMHFLNILLHTFNAVLVYCLALQLTDNNHSSVLAALFFAVHPINSETVNFISGGRNTLFSCLFVLTTYLFHHRSVVSGKIIWAVAGAVLFLFGLLSKETALMILPFAVYLEISFLRSTGLGRKLISVYRLFPYVVSVVVYFILRSIAISNAGADVRIMSGIGLRLMNNLYIIPRYLLSLLWPQSISPMYFIPEDFHVIALPLLAAWMIICGFFVWLITRGRSKVSILGLVWLVVFWLPVSGIVSIPSAPMADRYLYLPAIGFWIIIADQISHLIKHSRRKIYSMAAAVIFLLSGMTVAGNAYWKTDVVFFKRYVEKNPDKAFGHHNLGCAYLDTVGDIELAERSFKMALAIDPTFPRLRTQMGYIQLLRGNYSGAVLEYNEAIAQNPFDAEAYLNRAIALDRIGKYDDALSDYKRFLAIPGSELAGARAMAAGRIRELEK